MKHYIDGIWYSELGRQIKCNDLLNSLKAALAEYKAFHKQATKRKKRKRGDVK